MATISVRAALGAGFRLIRREPLAFLAWCVAYFFVGVLPQLVMLDALVPFMDAFRASGGNGADPAVIAAAERMGRYYLLYGLSLFVSITVIPGAVFRAVLTPQDRRVFFLRVGASEGWLGLSLLAIAGLTMLGFIVLSLPAGLIAAFAAPLAPLAMAAVMATLIWGLLRLSFAPVMGFADHGFRLAQSWRATPPLMGRLLLAAGGLFVLVLAGYMLTGVVAASFAPERTADTLIAGWKSDPLAVLERIGAGRIVALLTISTVFSTWSNVMGAAAWADMYRQLRDAPPAPRG